MTLMIQPKFMKKFKLLDKDKSGFLNHEEIMELSRWVYTSFRPDNKSLDEEQVLLSFTLVSISCHPLGPGLIQR